MNKGIWYAAGAYFIWGLFPIYWKWLQTVPALQLIGHRIGWSLILLFVLLLATRQWRAPGLQSQWRGSWASGWRRGRVRRAGP